MEVNHSGWNEDYGFFSYNVFVDENKTDYELHCRNGSIGYQQGPFHSETRDWNHDDDVYARFGAWFEFKSTDGKFCGCQFWSPQNMVRAVIDAMEQDGPGYDGEVISIPGIEVPARDKRPSLEQQIQQTERRTLAQEVDRNRKMNALGIRPSNEPWAR